MPRKKKSSGFYVTRDNDTPRVIGKLFGLDFQDIVAWNKARFPGLTAKSKFHAGTSVAIRAPGQEGTGINGASSKSHSRAKSKNSPTAGHAETGTTPRGQKGDATTGGGQRKRKKLAARKEPKKKDRRRTSSSSPASFLQPATFPQLQTYLSKPGQSLAAISELLCVDKATIAHLNRHLAARADLAHVLPALTEISVPTHTQSWPKAADFVGPTGGLELDEEVVGGDGVRHDDDNDDDGDDNRVASPSGGLPRRAVYYTQDGDTISVIAEQFGIDAHLLLGLNSPLYGGLLTIEAPLHEGTPIYLIAAETAACQDSGGPQVPQETTGSLRTDDESRQPVQAGQGRISANTRIRSLRATCFLYYARENETPASLSKRFDVECEDIVRLNEGYHAGLRRGALLRKFTRLYIPWKPDAAIDLSYCFSRLDMRAQPKALNSDMYTCVFVTNALDSVASICDHLGLNVDPVVELNSLVHEDLSASVRRLAHYFSELTCTRCCFPQNPCLRIGRYYDLRKLVDGGGGQTCCHGINNVVDGVSLYCSSLSLGSLVGKTDEEYSVVHAGQEAVLGPVSGNLDNARCLENVQRAQHGLIVGVN